MPRNVDRRWHLESHRNCWEFAELVERLSEFAGRAKSTRKSSNLTKFAHFFFIHLPACTGLFVEVQHAHVERPQSMTTKRTQHQDGCLAVKLDSCELRRCAQPGWGENNDRRNTRDVALGSKDS